MYFHVLQCMFRTFSMNLCFNFHKRFQIFVNIYIHIYTFSYIPCLGSTAGVMGPGMAWPSGPSQGLSPCKVALTWCTLLKSIWRCLHQQSNWQLIVKTISEVGWWVQPWKCFGSFILEVLISILLLGVVISLSLSPSLDVILSVSLSHWASLSPSPGISHMHRLCLHLSRWLGLHFRHMCFCVGLHLQLGPMSRSQCQSLSHSLGWSQSWSELFRVLVLVSIIAETKTLRTKLHNVP